MERLEICKKKKQRVQKGYLTKEETRSLKMRTETLLEIAEMRQNLWGCYWEGGGGVQKTPKNKRKSDTQAGTKNQPPGSKIQPVGLTGMKTRTVTEYFED